MLTIRYHSSQEKRRVRLLGTQQMPRHPGQVSAHRRAGPGGQVLMADTPARLNASQEFTESFFGVGPKVPQTRQAPKPS